MGLLLSEQEAKRFGEYCAREAETLRGIVNQMEKINVMQAVLKHTLARATAYEVVAKELLGAEHVSLGGEDAGR
jgi:alanine racemase